MQDIILHILVFLYTLSFYFLVGFKNNKSSYKTNLTKNATAVI